MMFKIEYDITTEHGIRTATFGFNFNSEWAARLKARIIRDQFNIDVYVINTETAEIVDFYWAT